MINMTHQGLGQSELWSVEHFRGCSKATFSSWTSTSYFSCLRFVLQVLPKPFQPFPATPPVAVCLGARHVSLPGAASGLLRQRCLCRPISVITAASRLNENCKGILMLTAAAKCFMALLRASSKLLPTALPKRQGGDGKKKKKFNFHPRWFFLVPTVAYTLSKGRGTLWLQVLSFPLRTVGSFHTVRLLLFFWR